MIIHKALPPSDDVDNLCKNEEGRILSIEDWVDSSIMDLGDLHKAE